MAIITFIPSGASCDTKFTVAQRGPTYPPPALTPPVVSLSDRLTSGQLQGQVAGAKQNYIIWKDSGTESTRSRWPMDTLAAVTAGLAAIATADAAGTNVSINALGVVV